MARIRRLEPGREPPDLVQHGLHARGLEPRGVQGFQFGVCGRVSGERLGRAVLGVQDIAGQAEHDRPVNRRQAGILDQRGQARPRGGQVPLLQVGGSQGHAGQQIGRRQRQGALAMHPRRIRIARLRVQPGQASERLDIVGIKCRGLPVSGPCAFDIVEILQQAAAIEIEPGPCEGRPQAPRHKPAARRSPARGPAGMRPGC